MIQKKTSNEVASNKKLQNSRTPSKCKSVTITKEQTCNLIQIFVITTLVLLVVLFLWKADDDFGGQNHSNYHSFSSKIKK